MQKTWKQKATGIAAQGQRDKVRDRYDWGRGSLRQWQLPFLLTRRFERTPFDDCVGTGVVEEVWIDGDPHDGRDKGDGERSAA